MKKIISIIIFVGLISACTDRFETVNKNPYTISNESLLQDKNFGVRFATLAQGLTTSQMGEDLATDTFVRHVGTPADFIGNRNNTTYYIIDLWNDNMWDRVYDNVMSPGNVIKAAAIAGNMPLYAAWVDLYQVSALSRLTVYHGPLIYSDYGKEDKPSYNYDSEEELYDQFFAKLDDIYEVFSEYAEAGNKELEKFDATYSGDLDKWLKYINSLRLRLAMRLVKVDPTLARYQGELAIADEAGLILTTADNFQTFLYGGRHPIQTMNHNWNDSRMSAAHEEFLIGYNDPRLYRWYEPVTGDASLYADHPEFPYKGITSGSYITAKDQRIPFSKTSAYFSQTGNGGKYRRFLTAGEVNFILAEAALRGWTTPGDKSAKEWYENGVRESFKEWEVEGVEEYLSDDTSLPLRTHVDPVDSRNNYDSRSSITIKWDEAVSDEENLERIMTQKWLDAFLNANEIWSDHRRTGYPKLHYTPKNDSNEDWGIIGQEDFLKRMPFVFNERMNNSEGVAGAVAKLGGPDKISTRLWIHPEGPNF
ncbi:MAG: SusD/RagB family nutrient-binding outer membrane lipoprotein [Bacteroidales bacterium]|jgi:hypothetical protein|nr:SusD/RagB family nutrient-binding outer membrane lipoprotein [Bacteroidales bacterium]